MARRRSLGLGGLWPHLAVAFLVVSLIGIVVNSVLVAVSLSADITAVAKRQEAALSRAAAYAAGAAYENRGWERADLRSVYGLVGQAGGAARIRDRARRVVGSSPGYAGYPSSGAKTMPIFSTTGRSSRPAVRVGDVTVRFDGRGLGALARTFEAQRLRSRILAAIASALLALIVSVVVARLIIRPIEIMLMAMRARASGNRGYRIANVSAPGVLRELLVGFNDLADALDAMDRVQRNLVADVAHEVRTPVAVLQAETEAMIDGVTEPTPANLVSLQAEVLRLARMVDGLQRLAAAESAGLQLKRRRYDLAEIVADVAERLREAFAARDVTLRLRLEQAVTLCDRDRIEDVVSNLLTNALKFTSAGGCVTLRTGPETDHYVFLRVSDTGIGIPAGELPHVTERFFRGRRAEGMAGGSGIGLAIVGELVRAHRGHLVISSEEGRGTQVLVTLPTTEN